MDFAGIFRAIGVRGFAAIGLGLALAIVMWRANAISEQREALRDALAGEEARHAVTRQSVDTLSGELAKLVEEGKLRAERVDEAMMQVAEDTATLRDEARRIEREGVGADYADELKEMGL